MMDTQRMKRIAAHLVFLLLTFMAAHAFGQEGAYRLQPEDIIHIQVYNETQITGDFEIGKDGNVSAPFVGIVHAAGKTTSELEQELKELYIKKLFLRDPIVSVTITRYRVMRASISGSVQRAGAFPFRQGDTLMTLYSQAGGHVEGQADLRRAMLRRGNSQEQIPIDLEALLFYGDTSQNYTLQDGDELIIPQDRDNRIVVWGAVQQPGTLVYQKGIRVSDALGFGRGDIRNVSKFSQTTILRRAQGAPERYYAIKVDMVRFYHKNDYTQNIELQRGDIVFVPSTNTPNLNDIGSILNTAFFANRVFFEDGLFGFRPLSFIGR